MLVPIQGEEGPKGLRWYVHAIWQETDMEDDVLFARSLRNRVADGGVIEKTEMVAMATLLISSVQRVDASDDDSVTELRFLVPSVQFLANASVREGDQRRKCWEAFHPHALRSVSVLKLPDVMEPFCYALRNFMRSGYFCLDEGVDIFERLVSGYGQEQDSGANGTFSMLISEVFLHYRDYPVDSPSMLCALQFVDASCLEEGAAHTILCSLLDAAKRSTCRKILKALKNVVQCEKARADVLTDVTSWVLGALMDPKTEQKRENGYRSGLISVLCNLLFGRVYLQDMVIDSEGLACILNSIKLDESNPYMREWALLCVRNMCMENPRARDYIRRLEWQDVVTDDVLGVDVEYDKKMGQFRAHKR